MGFWSNSAREPLSKFRFQVYLGDHSPFQDVVSVELPEIEVNSSDFLLLNHTFNIPGNVTWSDCTITFVDSQNSIQQQFGFLIQQG